MTARAGSWPSGHADTVSWVPGISLLGPLPGMREISNLQSWHVSFSPNTAEQ